MAEKEDNINVIDQLIHRYLSGISSSDEDTELLSWVSLSQENKRYFQQMSDIWDISNLPANKKKVNSNQAYLSFKKQTNASKPIRILKFVYAVAAAILMLAAFYVIYDHKYEKTNLVAFNEMLSDTLPDGTVVSLNKNSNLLYFHKKIKRKRFAIMEGEVFFNVQHDSSNPFEVMIGKIKITVTGTSFNVKSKDELIELSLIEGGILVNYNDTIEGYNLHAGESILINDKSGVIETHAKLDPNDITWKTNEFIFSNTELKEVFSRLEELYAITFQYDPLIIESYRFDGKLSADDLDLIISTLEVTFNLNIIAEGDRSYSIKSIN